jgi:LPXTG-site transpeptidase (sortase) family protein
MVIPVTGFAPNQVTNLPEQAENMAYLEMSDLWLEIPSLGIKMDILGVPVVDNSWDVSWLGNRAGWLESTAFPTSDGNSLITGHVYMPNGKPGPFVYLRNLKWGDQVIIHSHGQSYVYQVRQVKDVLPTDKSAFKHEDLPWVTLVTCRGYNPSTNTYAQRTIVRAVLVSVTSDTASSTSQK